MEKWPYKKYLIGDFVGEKWRKFAQVTNKLFGSFLTSKFYVPHFDSRAQSEASDLSPVRHLLYFQISESTIEQDLAKNGSTGPKQSFVASLAFPEKYSGFWNN